MWSHFYYFNALKKSLRYLTWCEGTRVMTLSQKTVNCCKDLWEDMDPTCLVVLLYTTRWCRESLIRWKQSQQSFQLFTWIPNNEHTKRFLFWSACVSILCRGGKEKRRNAWFCIFVCFCFLTVAVSSHVSQPGGGSVSLQRKQYLNYREKIENSERK